MLCKMPEGADVSYSANLSFTIHNVAIKAKLPPQSAKADSSPIAYAMGEPLNL